MQNNVFHKVLLKYEWQKLSQYYYIFEKADLSDRWCYLWTCLTSIIYAKYKVIIFLAVFKANKGSDRLDIMHLLSLSKKVKYKAYLFHTVKLRKQQSLENMRPFE